MSELIPPDHERCQAEVHERAPFMQMGGPPVRVTRCSNKPTVIATEVVGDEKGRGSMSLCDECLKIAYDKLGPGYFTAERIT